MGLQALGNRIIVETVKKEDDDILIPESSRSKDQEKAKVVAVGPGVRLPSGQVSPVWVIVGDIVYFNPFGGSKLKHEGKDYLVLNEEDILAVEK